MQIFEILRNPLVKLIGIGLVLYFALFANTEHPKSLGNRLSSEQIKKDLADAKDKSAFIIKNVKMANDLSKKAELTTPENIEISTQDLEIGSGDLSPSCGDEATISYGIYSQDGRQIRFVDSAKILLGSQSSMLLEKNILGMKLGGVRNIIVPQGSQVSDPKIFQILQSRNSGLKIQVTLISFVKTTSQNLSCN
jgi:hypothetical protein